MLPEKNKNKKKEKEKYTQKLYFNRAGGNTLH